jgi:endonuclease-8
VPEGDTIAKLTAALASDLKGAVVRRLRLQRSDPRPLEGRRIERVFSKGKHLFLVFDNGLLLRSHLGLYGTWHAYAPGEKWRKPARWASIVLETGRRTFVCFSAREVEILRAGGYRLVDTLDRLGPDLTQGPPDAACLVRRARGLLEPATRLVDLLLDQRVASGIGNVFKSEVLFLAGQHPARRLVDTPDDLVVELYGEASRLLAHNLRTGSRVTRLARDGLGDLWVYGRAARPCWRCGSPIRRELLGVTPRSTYWCPGCQAGGGTHRLSRNPETRKTR